MKGRRVVVTMTLATALVATGCSEARTDSTQQAIRYTGGQTQVEKFDKCQSAPDLDYGSPGDHVYYYPQAQRTYSFTDDQNAKPETGPISVSTKNRQQLLIRGYFAFTLTTDCAKLQKFHEVIGKRMKADFPQGAQEDDDKGWNAFLAQYFTTPVNSIADATGLQYNWQDLYGDAEVQAKFEKTLTDSLGAEINRQVGDGVITIVGSDVQRPEPNPELLASLQKVEQAKADAAAEVEKIRGQRTVQQQKNLLARDEVRGAKQCQRAYTKDQCLIKDLARDGQIPFYPIPPGGSVIVGKE